MWQRLNPNQKRVAIALGGAGILAVFAMLSRRGRPQTVAPTAEEASAGAYDWSSYPSISGGGGTIDPGTPAPVDTGLADTVAQGLGDVALALDSYGQAQQGLTDRISALEDQPAPTFDLAGIQAAVDAAVAASFAAAAAPAAPTVAAAPAATVAARPPRDSRAQAARRQGALLQTRGTRAGLAYKPVVKRGRFYRFYESRPGRGDFGAKPGSKIYVRPASTRPSQTPKGRQPDRRRRRR